MLCTYEYVVNFSNIGLREFSKLAYRLEIPTFPELTYVKQRFVLVSYCFLLYKTIRLSTMLKSFHVFRTQKNSIYLKQKSHEIFLI
jgi:hypothetical protein